MDDTRAHGAVIKQNLLPDSTPKAKRKLRPFNSVKPDI
jgi:hypothetical protein